MKQIEMVKEFHETYGMPVVSQNIPIEDRDISRISMRLLLIAEEFSELVEASTGIDKELVYESTTDYIFFPKKRDPDYVEIADALGDLLYVVNGMALELGIPLEEVFKEIHRSNMSKLDENGNPIYREDGKVLKGPNFSEPKIKELLLEKITR